MQERISAKEQLCEWFAASPEKILAVRNKIEDTESLKKLHIESDSFLGEIAGWYSFVSLCGGYFCLLCSSGENSLTDINMLDKNGFPELFPGALVIAYDVNGNIFAVNAGCCPGARAGSVLYLPADSFSWEDLELRYADFLNWITDVTEKELVDNGWKPTRNGKTVVKIRAFLTGKSAAYNSFRKAD